MRQALADRLRTKIITGELAPGAHLVEDVIAKEYEVSKTPVREALMSLVRTGLVEMKPHCGAFVIHLTPRFVEEVSTLRLELEMFAARLAIAKFTTDDFAAMRDYARQMEAAVLSQDVVGALTSDTAFHSTIIGRAEHHLLAETWESLSHRVELVQAYGRLIAPIPEPGHVVNSHDCIVDALRDQDIELLNKRLREHVQFGSMLVLANLSKMPESPHEP
jgi:DNA-binding GntR family transcriptional regulator